MEALDTDQFWSEFTPGLSQLSEEVAGFSVENCSAELLTRVRARFSELQHFATDAARFLPPYDVKRSQTALEALKRDISAAETKFLPRKKFSFRGNRSTEHAQTDTRETPATQDPHPSIEDVCERSTAIAPGTVVIEGLIGEKRCLSRADVTSPDSTLLPQILIRNCQSSVVAISSLLGYVRLQGLSDCEVYLGPCSTAIYLEDLQRCTVHASSHQMRIHDCRDCDLYVKTKSSPIIEDCSNMGFALNRTRYDGYEADLEVALQF